MDNYLTYERIKNLQILAILLNDLKGQTLDYIREKYFQIISSYPDKEIVDNKIKSFENFLEVYSHRWNYKLTDDDVKLLYGVRQLTEHPIDCKTLIKSYFKCYTTISYVNNIDKSYLLHPVVREKLDSIHQSNEQIYKIYKRCSKIMRLRNNI